MDLAARGHGFFGEDDPGLHWHRSEPFGCPSWVSRNMVRHGHFKGCSWCNELILGHSGKGCQFKRRDLDGNSNEPPCSSPSPSIPGIPTAQALTQVYLFQKSHHFSVHPLGLSTHGFCICWSIGNRPSRTICRKSRDCSRSSRTWRRKTEFSKTKTSDPDSQASENSINFPDGIRVEIPNRVKAQLCLTEKIKRCQLGIGIKTNMMSWYSEVVYH